MRKKLRDIIEVNVWIMGILMFILGLVAIVAPKFFLGIICTWLSLHAFILLGYLSSKLRPKRSVDISKCESFFTSLGYEVYEYNDILKINYSSNKLEYSV